MKPDISTRTSEWLHNTQKHAIYEAKSGDTTYIEVRRHTVHVSLSITNEPRYGRAHKLPVASHWSY